MSKITLKIECLEAGRFTAAVSADGQSIQMFLSYLSDGLAELTQAAAGLLQGSRQATFAWADEPGEWRWVVVNRANWLHIKILEFNKTFSHEPDENGKLIFETECETLRFATQVKGQMHQMLNEHGLEGYKARWRHDFPEMAFRRLTALIEQFKQESTRR